MATAELAVALPVVILVLALCLGAVQLGIDKVRCVGAAGAGARSAARGDPLSAAASTARRAAPAGSTVAVSVGEADVQVEVRAPRGWLERALGIDIAPGATAVAVREGSNTSGLPP